MRISGPALEVQQEGSLNNQQVAYFFQNFPAKQFSQASLQPDRKSQFLHYPALRWMITRPYEKPVCSVHPNISHSRNR